MQKIFVGMLVAALAVVAAPVNASSTTFEKNLSFITELVGDVDMNGVATFADGTTMTVGDALAATAARAGNVDLQSIALGAAPAGAGQVGDVWVLSIGSGSCTATVIAATPVPNTAFHPQFYTYAGGVGTLETSNSFGGINIGWTTKTAEGVGANGFTATGQQDFFCFGFFGLHLAFPFIDGHAASN